MDLSSLASLGSVNSLLPGKVDSSSSTNPTSMFSDLYEGLINNVNSTDQAFNGDIVKAAEGELDNPHQLVIDSSKANIALKLFSSVRNNALTAYNDIIKMSV